MAVVVVEGRPGTQGMVHGQALHAAFLPGTLPPTGRAGCAAYINSCLRDHTALMRKHAKLQARHWHWVATMHGSFLPA